MSSGCHDGELVPHSKACAARGAQKGDPDKGTTGCKEIAIEDLRKAVQVRRIRRWQQAGAGGERCQAHA